MWLYDYPPPSPLEYGRFMSSTRIRHRGLRFQIHYILPISPRIGKNCLMSLRRKRGIVIVIRSLLRLIRASSAPEVLSNGLRMISWLIWILSGHYNGVWTNPMWCSKINFESNIENTKSQNRRTENSIKLTKDSQWAPKNKVCYDINFIAKYSGNEHSQTIVLMLNGGTPFSMCFWQELGKVFFWQPSYFKKCLLGTQLFLEEMSRKIQEAPYLEIDFSRRLAFPFVLDLRFYSSNFHIFCNKILDSLLEVLYTSINLHVEKKILHSKYLR